MRKMIPFYTKSTYKYYTYFLFMVTLFYQILASETPHLYKINQPISIKKDGQPVDLIVTVESNPSIMADWGKNHLNRSLEIVLTFKNNGKQNIECEFYAPNDFKKDSSIFLVDNQGESIGPSAISVEGSQVGYRTVGTEGGIFIVDTSEEKVCFNQGPNSIYDKQLNTHIGIAGRLCTKPGAIGVVRFVFIKPKNSREIIINLSNLCDISKFTCPSKDFYIKAAVKTPQLEEIAKNDVDWEARMSAVMQLTNRYLLAEIAKNDKKWLVRKTAHEKLGNEQAVQAEIAKNDEDWKKREAAVGKITDQAVLADIGKNDQEWRVGLAAVKNLTDQALLSDFAKNCKNVAIKCAALENLNFKDQDYLAEIIKNENNLLRKVAVGNPNFINQPLLIDIAKNDKNLELRYEAANKLSDKFLAQKIYNDLAFNTPDNSDGNSRIRFDAAGKLTDKPAAQKAYVDIVINGYDEDIRKHAIEKITDQSIIAEIAKANNLYKSFYISGRTDEDKEVQRFAASMITEQALIADVAKNAPNENVRGYAVRKLSDQAVLVDIAKNEEYPSICEDAVWGLKDQVMLTDVAKNGKAWTVRSIAVGKLIDQAVLSEIAKNDKNDDVRKAAVERLEALEQK